MGLSQEFTALPPPNAVLGERLSCEREPGARHSEPAVPGFPSSVPVPASGTLQGLTILQAPLLLGSQAGLAFGGAPLPPTGSGSLSSVAMWWWWWFPCCHVKVA